MGAATCALRKHSSQPFMETIGAVTREGGDADTYDLKYSCPFTTKTQPKIRNAAVAGALLGAYQGYSSLPCDWIMHMPHQEWLHERVDMFLEVLGQQPRNNGQRT